MKVVVISTGKKGSKSYLVEVVDGSRTIFSEKVVGIKQRDALVWKVMDLYNCIDLEMTDVDELPVDEDFRFSEIPSIPVLDEEDARSWFEDGEDIVFGRIMQAVDEGIRSKRNSVRLFELNGTGVYITSNREDWKGGLEQAIKYFVKTEEYEKCIVCRQLLSKL